jgi:predicted DNA-binding transcriptional regulator AlpA
MRRSPTHRQTVAAFEAGAQLPLGLDEYPSRIPSRRIQARPPPRVKQPGVDPVVWMRDLCDLFGVHRCTIHRWMTAGTFPKKDAPADHPRGWKLSTLRKWQDSEAAARRTQTLPQTRSPDARI